MHPRVDLKLNLYDARRMLSAFDSVGARYYTLVAERDDKVFYSRRYVDGELIYLNLRGDLEFSYKNECNLHLRPYCTKNTLIQLDDVGAGGIFSFVARLPEGAELPAPQGQDCEAGIIEPFLITETSHRNYQCWIALEDKFDAEEVKNIKALFKADPGATGSCRLAGSVNYKEKHWPNFPIVISRYTHEGMIADSAHMRRLLASHTARVARGNTAQEGRATKKKYAHLKSPAANLLGSVSKGKQSISGERRWPFYETALKLAPLKNDGTGADRSRADFMWCKMALKFGHSIEDVANRLIWASPKCREKEGLEAVEYALQTTIVAAQSFK